MALNTSDPRAVRQAAHDILSQPQFTSQKPSTWDRVIFYATHPLDLLTLVLNWVASQFLGSGVHTIVASVVAVLIAAIGVFMIVRFSRSATRNNAVRIHYAPVATNKTVRQLITEAEALEQNQLWRDAIRVRYSALVQHLSEQGVVRARSGRTTGEYAREVALNAPAVANAFSEATRIFEWVWYGKGEPGSGDLAEFKAFALDATQKVAA